VHDRGHAPATSPSAGGGPTAGIKAGKPGG
jgi:hypothetical protein